MTSKISFKRWSGGTDTPAPLRNELKGNHALNLNAADKCVNQGFLQKFSEKLESVLSSFPLESNLEGNGRFTRNFKNSVFAERNSGNNGSKKLSDVSQFGESNKLKSQFSSNSETNRSNIIGQLQKQNSMDRMELTLKLTTTSKLSDSDESDSGSKVPTRASSQESVTSSCSTVSSECIPDETERSCQEFMKMFTGKLFTNSSLISYEEKAKFGEVSRNEAGRRWFSRYMNSQRVKCKSFEESTFYSLVQYFSIMLFECSECDDFSPAKSLMNMAFTFYHTDEMGSKEFLFKYLKNQSIWQSLRYWNAAFFEAVQTERENKPMIKSQEINLCTPEDIKEDECFQENITFGQLATFTFNMQAFGLSKKFCLEFLRKQCIIANLSQEQDSMLVGNVHRMFGKEA